MITYDIAELLLYFAAMDLMRSEQLRGIALPIFLTPSDKFCTPLKIPIAPSGFGRPAIAPSPPIAAGLKQAAVTDVGGVVEEWGGVPATDEGVRLCRDDDGDLGDGDGEGIVLWFGDPISELLFCCVLIGSRVFSCFIAVAWIVSSKMFCLSSWDFLDFSLTWGRLHLDELEVDFVELLVSGISEAVADLWFRQLSEEGDEKMQSIQKSKKNS